MKALIHRMDINVHRWETADDSSRLTEKFSEVLTESVDTAVSIHQYDGTLVKPTREVHTLIDVADENVNLEWSCANDKFAAYDHWRYKRVSSGRVSCRTGNGSRLQEVHYKSLSHRYFQIEHRRQTQSQEMKSRTQLHSFNNTLVCYPNYTA